MDEGKSIQSVTAIIIKSISSISILLYCLHFYCLCYIREKKTLSVLINIQLTITCFLQSISYLLPTAESELWCTAQASLCVFGILGKLTIAITIVFICQLNFSDIDNKKSKRNACLITCCIISWIFPIIIGIICIIYGDITNYSQFCWIEVPGINQGLRYTRFTYIGMFYIITVKLYCEMKKILKDDEEEFNSFRWKVIKYSAVITITLINYIGFGIFDDYVDYFNLNYPTLIHVSYGILDVLEGFNSPLFVAGFLIDNEIIHTIKTNIFCQKDKRNNGSTISAFYNSMEDIRETEFA